MLELPEVYNLSRKMTEVLPGKEIQDIEFRRVPKLEEWGMITQQVSDFKSALVGARIIGIESNPWFVYLILDNLNFLAIGELDGKVVYDPGGIPNKGKLNLRLFFSDSSTLTVFVKLWGVLKVFDKEGMIDHHNHYLDMSLSPLSDSFTTADMIYFIKGHDNVGKLNVKKFITTKVYVNGLGNGFLQEILYRSKIHPRTKIKDLDETELKQFHKAIRDVTIEGIEENGRTNQYDLFNKPGHFVSRINKDTVGTKCSECGTITEKMSFEGGTCYICPGCQDIK